MSWQDVQALVLRPAPGASVLHLLFRVTQGRGGEAIRRLQAILGEQPLTLGAGQHGAPLHCTLGFTYRGLQALNLPNAYLRVFWRLAPPFAQGAPLRSARLGDSGASAPAHWQKGFALDNAHVLITLHGERKDLAEFEARCRKHWEQADGPLRCIQLLEGARLGAPEGKVGEWVHFGFRDSLTDHRIAGVIPRPGSSRLQGDVPAPVEHAAGEFLLGHPDDIGVNRFSLAAAPRKVRDFFHDSSFGVLRPMRQDVTRFQKAVQEWRLQAETALGRAVSEDWVRAKLCGRWPTGEAMRPGQSQPAPRDWHHDFEADAKGTGCPWFAHVRRMDPRGHRPADARARPLLRRGMPYGSANWEEADDARDRGLLGLFFCASLEGQFEQLLGQWANAGVPGMPQGQMANDALAGHHEDSAASVQLPLDGAPSLRLSGFQRWTQTLGTVYCWHPTGAALKCILEQDYVPVEEAGPWL